MGGFRKLSADWQPIWNAAPVQARAYLGKFVRYLVDKDLQPDDVRQEHFTAWSRTRSGREAEVGHLNTVIHRYSELRRPDGRALPSLQPLDNRNDRRAAVNAALPAAIRDEIARTRRYLSDALNPKTVDAIERRLFEVARHPKVGAELASFRDLADPNRLANFVTSFEDDPDGLQLTIRVNRTRQLQEVARTLAICGADAEAEAIEREVATHPKHGLAPAESTQAKLAIVDDEGLDQRRREAAFNAILAFYKEHGP